MATVRVVLLLLLFSGTSVGMKSLLGYNQPTRSRNEQTILSAVNTPSIVVKHILYTNQFHFGALPLALQEGA